MKRISIWIDQLNAFIGQKVSWLSLILIGIIILDVFLRYLFNWSSPALFEVEWHLFSILFLLSAGWALQQDKHVRVDVFYNRFSENKKALVNLFGSLLLLLPLCIVGFWESLPFARSAFAMGETSTDPGGLPARFIIKSMIPLSFLLLGFQAISLGIKSLLQLTQKHD